MTKCTTSGLCWLQYVLARIFGTNDALFSREDEQRIFSQVAEVGLGPKLLVLYSFKVLAPELTRSYNSARIPCKASARPLRPLNLQQELCKKISLTATTCTSKNTKRWYSERCSGALCNCCRKHKVSCRGKRCDAQANFKNGRIEEFLQDQAISAEEMQSGPIAFCVASAMAHFHFSPLILSSNGVAPKPILWERTRSWARTVQQHYSAGELQVLRLQNVLQEVRSSTPTCLEAGASCFTSILLRHWPTACQAALHLVSAVVHHGLPHVDCQRVSQWSIAPSLRVVFRSEFCVCAD